MLRFSIIIVSWNALDHLKIFLPSVVDTDYPDFEIIIADNASTDGSVEWVKKNYPDVKIATFDKNYGYCGGNNRAVPHASGDILLFLNNDVNVKPEWLTHLAECFQQNDKLAVLQPKMLSFREPGNFEYAGGAGGFLDKYGYPFCRGRIFDTPEQDWGHYDTKIPIFWASGAAFAIRREVFEKLNGFDEDFEFHMEEIDLCWQLWNQGYKVGFCPESVVYHLGGGSMPMGSPRKAYYNYRNNLIMLVKNYADSSLVTRLPVRIILDLIAALRELFTGNFKVCAAILKAHFHFYASIAQTNGKRNELQSLREIDQDPPMMMDKSIVWEYFIKGKKHFRELDREL